VTQKFTVAAACRAFKEVTCAAVVVQHLAQAHHQIDYAISEALVGGVESCWVGFSGAEWGLVVLSGV
jgi:hypothetical protein